MNAGTPQTRAASALPSQVTLWGLQRSRGRGFPSGSAGVSQPHLGAAPRAGSGGGQCPGSGGRAEPRGPAGPSGEHRKPSSPRRQRRRRAERREPAHLAPPPPVPGQRETFGKSAPEKRRSKPESRPSLQPCPRAARARPHSRPSIGAQGRQRSGIPAPLPPWDTFSTPSTQRFRSVRPVRGMGMEK